MQIYGWLMRVIYLQFNLIIILLMRFYLTPEKEKILPNTPFLEWHYIKNNFFLKPNQLIKHKKKLSNIKISIIQSDYDLLCPPQTSFNFASGYLIAR